MLKWKPPLYTGASIYSYEIRLHGRTVEGIILKLLRFHYIVFMNRQDDDWIYSSPIYVSSGLQQEVFITAQNDAGEGMAKSFWTQGRFSYFILYMLCVS